MATRIKDWIIPYTWGIGIEITNNHVINVLLRAMNNLIHYTGEDDPDYDWPKELYVDLQLDDGITPEDDFPVGVTTGKILQADWWQQSGLILNRKTTSGDYTRLITANDWNLYIDLGDWIWRLLWWSWGGGILDCNVKKFVLTGLDDSTTGQAVVDWYLQWNYPIIVYQNESYILENKPDDTQIRFWNMHTTKEHDMNSWLSVVKRYALSLSWIDDTFDEWQSDYIEVSPSVIGAGIDYSHAFMPTYDSDPVSKKYVDDGLVLKQDILIAGQHITITNNTISADINWVLVYKWNVSDVSDLANIQNPSVWDTYFVEGSDAMYSWDWTQWNQVGGTWIDLTDFFNKTTDDSDDITEWSNHLFVTPQEKSDWNAKQDPIQAWENITINNDWVTINSVPYTEWDWIDITNHVVSNTKPFEPNNEWSLGQFLKKSSEWYSRANIPWGQGDNYTAWDGISINLNNVISNTKPFEPINNWSVGQVLTRTSRWYYWQTPSGWGGWGWGWGVTSVNGQTWAVTVVEFEPNNSGNSWDVLVKTNNWYQWWKPANVRAWTIDSNDISQQTLLEVVAWVVQDWWNYCALLKDIRTDDTFIYNSYTTSWGLKFTFVGTKRYTRMVTWTAANHYGNYTKWWNNILEITATTSWDTVTYSAVVKETDDDDAKTNYISVIGSGYTTAFRPTDDFQPATKGYVDAVATWWWIPYTAWNGIDIDNNVISNIWVLSWDSGTVYTVKVSSSAPASWTPNTTITFKTAS